ncbi:MAG: TetR/AcrR family transcriptional regulator [Eubacterium sp.]|nr:TetR/AcrR family transcriptional regulator [Eubacterium sp.]
MRDLSFYYKDDNSELREKILLSTMEVFNSKGLKFTMDDIARNINISKKTIYKVFNDKEEMFLELVDYLFDGIKDAEMEVANDESLSTLEKIRKILGVMPNSYKDIDFRQLYMLRDKYPKIYEKVEERLENGWELTISLIEKGMEEGVIRPIRIPILKMMLESSLEQFFRRDVLISNKMTYQDGLNEVVDILVDGISQ